MKKIILLDVDGCMYHYYDKDGHFTPYTAHARLKTEEWVKKTTQRTIEEFREYRKTQAPKVGIDQALLDFVTLYKREYATIQQIYLYRSDPQGFNPEDFLVKNDALVTCLKKIKKVGYTLVVISDNPIAKRIVRQLGIDPNTIPDEMIFDSIRLNGFKNPTTLKRVLTELQVGSDTAAMFGDSERSDILPAQSIGIRAFLTIGPDALIEALENYVR